MKICILLTLCITVSTAPAPQAIDWDTVEGLVQIIRDGMYTSGIDLMKTIAISDNPEIGLIISAKLDEVAVNGTILLDNAYAPIQARNLTGHQMRELFATYGLYSSTAEAHIWDDVEQLTWDALVKIADYFYVQDLFEHYHYYQIHYYLEETPLNPVNWEEARNGFLYVASLATSGSSSIKDLIIYGNSNLTDELFPIVEAAEGETIEKIDRALALIGNETLGLRESIELINNFHNLMNELNRVVSEYEWPDEVWWSFLFLFHDLFTNSHLAGLEIYDALTGVDFFKSGKESTSFNNFVFAKRVKSLKSKFSGSA